MTNCYYDLHDPGLRLQYRSVSSIIQALTPSEIKRLPYDQHKINQAFAFLAAAHSGEKSRVEKRFKQDARGGFTRLWNPTAAMKDGALAKVLRVDADRLPSQTLERQQCPVAFNP